MGVNLSELCDQGILKGLITGVSLFPNKNREKNDITIFFGQDNIFADDYSVTGEVYKPKSQFQKNNKIYLLSEKQSNDFDSSFLTPPELIKPYVIKSVRNTELRTILEPSSPKKTKSYIGINPEIYHALKNFGYDCNVDVIPESDLNNCFLESD